VSLHLRNKLRRANDLSENGENVQSVHAPNAKMGNKRLIRAQVATVLNGENALGQNHVTCHRESVGNAAALTSRSQKQPLKGRLRANRLVRNALSRAGTRNLIADQKKTRARRRTVDASSLSNPMTTMKMTATVAAAASSSAMS